MEMNIFPAMFPGMFFKWGILWIAFNFLTTRNNTSLCPFCALAKLPLSLVIVFSVASTLFKYEKIN